MSDFVGIMNVYRCVGVYGYLWVPMGAYEYQCMSMDVMGVIPKLFENFRK